jgi:hypothetical protein
MRKHRHYRFFQRSWTLVNRMCDFDSPRTASHSPQLFVLHSFTGAKLCTKADELIKLTIEMR